MGPNFFSRKIGYMNTTKSYLMQSSPFFLKTPSFLAFYAFLGLLKNSCFSNVTQDFVEEAIKVNNIGLICIDVANFLRKKNWSHGTNLGYLG